MYRWHHQVSVAWMLARRDVITATELASCRSAYSKATEDQKAGRKLLPAFASIWLQKQSDTPVDPCSFGAMARGHIVEPYAVDDYNRNEHEVNEMPRMYHWDDVVLKRDGVGWSPDALSIPQEAFGHEMQVEDDCLSMGDVRLPLPDSFLEIKCYEPKTHMQRMLTVKEKLDERWQLAVGFHVVPTIEKACLLFYSVDTDASFAQWYFRDELEEEIRQVADMAALWKRNRENLDSMPPRFTRTHDEEEIHGEWLQSECSMPELLRI